MRADRDRDRPGSDGSGVERTQYLLRDGLRPPPSHHLPQKGDGDRHVGSERFARRLHGPGRPEEEAQAPGEVSRQGRVGAPVRGGSHHRYTGVWRSERGQGV